MVEKYDGDARHIWSDRAAAGSVLDRLLDLGAGVQISRMIVRALKDVGVVVGASDVKADIHVRRVLGRSVEGTEITVDKAHEIARQMHPLDPSELDWPLLNVGKMWCRKTSPRCGECYLKALCIWAITASRPE